MQTPRTLVFATRNAHKVQEVQALLGDRVKIVSLDAIDCEEELPETASTFEGNAAQKAQYVHDKYGVDCFADDSGLETDALNGAPGIYSARFAGTGDAGDNIRRLLREMKDATRRGARFRAVLVSIIGEEQVAFEGTLEGTITDSPRGERGFGYDPVFVPAGETRTLAEMMPEEKNAISHRGEACRRFAAYLTQLETRHPAHGSI